MREIKFRAWDKLMNEYVYWSSEIGVDLFWEMVRKKKLESPEEYTGLKDNSDPPQEIYEGDIVQLDKFICEVKWHLYGWFIFFNQGNHKSVLALHDQDKSSSKYDLKKIKILGNVYENSELLENAPK